MKFSTLPVLTMLFALQTTALSAGPVSFAEGWREQRLSLFSSNEYKFASNLSLVSESAVSIAWTRVAQGDWKSTRASWNWTVEQSVPATNLAQKGGDDRNISLYFVFVPENIAPKLRDANIRSLLGNDDVRIIQYAWGGGHTRGQVIPSPYGPDGQGVTIALRQAGTGSYNESVDLAKDYGRAFGDENGVLVGLAVSGDSDDTNSVIRAAIENLHLG
ncbi:hypothetical protein GGR95_003644 [Sulfitobacter undariae]|uniref:DUF3047 domain-containing protein n=1 Tax=Sulfitobacter undariae TaxID=1563671 RepID=A0A7W6E775_9RHOB|nr:DUF3047 domain-containing protein [Sulfitobacter undariae]MBB3995978.1 hypothetical protein [Sulfitobacter undariae]